MPIKVTLYDNTTHYVNKYIDIFNYENIKILDISNNEQITLHKIPETCQTLICNDNSLRELPEFPVSLIEVDCSNNNISEIKNLNNVKRLVCFDNRFPKNYFDGMKKDGIVIID